MAPKKTAAEILDSVIEASLKGDPLVALETSIPDAFDGLRRVGRALSFFPEAPSYRIEPVEGADKEERFVVHLESPERKLRAAASMRRIRGAWKIVELDLLPEYDELFRPHDAEEALRFACEAALRGDAMEFSDTLTSAAFVDMMRITAAWGLLPVPETFIIEHLPPEGEEFRFTLRLKSGEHEVDATAALQQIDDEWKITSIKLPGVRD